VNQTTEHIILNEQKQISDLYVRCNAVYASLFYNTFVRQAIDLRVDEDVPKTLMRTLGQELARLQGDENNPFNDVQLSLNNIGFMVSSRRAEPIADFYLTEGDMLLMKQQISRF
jgi:hypothetical protein